MTQVILTRIPSKLIRLALSDLMICESQPEKYEIIMDVWYISNIDFCSVCFAGAVMANTTNENFDGSARSPYDDNPNRDCYVFLDKMRQAERRGAMLRGCNCIDATPIHWDKVIPIYRHDKDAFHKAMNELADAFEASGQ